MISCHHCLRPVPVPVQPVLPQGQRLKQGRAARLSVQAGHFVLLQSQGCPAGTVNTVPHGWAPPCTQGYVFSVHTAQTTKTAQSHQRLYWNSKRTVPGSPWPPSSVGEGDESLHHVAHVLAQAALRRGPGYFHLRHLQRNSHGPVQHPQGPRAGWGHGDTGPASGQACTGLLRGCRFTPKIWDVSPPAWGPAPTHNQL